MDIDKPPKQNSPEKEKELRAILGKIQEKVINQDDMTFQGLTKLQKELSDRATYLIKKYPNSRDHLMFHVLTGSTMIPGGPAISEDFPGDDSVEKFIKDLAERYK